MDKNREIQILKDAGIVKMRREGTRNYYYFDADYVIIAGDAGYGRLSWDR